MSVSELAEMECVPCKGGIPPLKGEALADLHAKLGNDWKVIDEHHLVKRFKFDDFRQALDYANRVGALAESVNHHPEICVAWGKVEITLWTHKIGGLSETDFVFAAKSDGLLEEAS